MLVLSCCGAPSRHPLADLLLLLGREHIENLTVLNPSVPLEHRILRLRAQLFVFGHGLETRLCILMNLVNLGFLVVRQRQAGKKVGWGSVFPRSSRRRPALWRRCPTGRTGL